MVFVGFFAGGDGGDGRGGCVGEFGRATMEVVISPVCYGEGR